MTSPQTDVRISVTNISFDADIFITTNGESGQLTATAYPTNHTDGDLQWQSSDTNIFVVNQNGIYQAPSWGTATVTASLGDISNTLSVTVKALGTNLDISNHIATLTSHFYGQSNVYFSNRFTAIIHYTTNGFTNLFLSNDFQSNLIGDAFSLSNIAEVSTNVFTNTNVVAIDEDSYLDINRVTNEVAGSNVTTNQFVKEVVFYEQPTTNTNWMRFDFSGVNLSYLILTNYNLKDADLRNADLRNADLTNADLRSANLSNANFISFVDKFGNAGTGDGQFQGPSGMAVDDNYIYTLDTDREDVQVFARGSYSFVTNFGSNRLGNPNCIAVDNDSIYVGDPSDYNVEIFAKTTWIWGTNIEGSRGFGDGQFVDLTSIAVDDNFIYVVDARRGDMQVFNQNTRAFVATFGNAVPEAQIVVSNGDLRKPIRTIIDNDFIYILDNGRDDVQLFNQSNYAFVDKFAWMVTEINTLQSADIALDDFFIYITDGDKDEVQIFDKATRTYITRFGGTGNSDGQFQVNSNIKVLDGFIYVMDGSRLDVQVFSSSLQGAKF